MSEDAIPFTSVNIRTMADGTVRLAVDCEPEHGPNIMRLFGTPGSPGAIVRLTDESAKAQMQQETIAKDRPKGGALSRDAAGLCRNVDFLRFVSKRTNYDADENDAADYLRHFCGIKSRAELDHNEEAKIRYAELKRQYWQWNFDDE